MRARSDSPAQRLLTVPQPSHYHSPDVTLTAVDRPAATPAATGPNAGGHTTALSGQREPGDDVAGLPRTLRRRLQNRVLETRVPAPLREHRIRDVSLDLRQLRVRDRTALGAGESTIRCQTRLPALGTPRFRRFLTPQLTPPGSQRSSAVIRSSTPEPRCSFTTGPGRAEPAAPFGHRAWHPQPHIRDRSTSTSQPGRNGSKPCSMSQRIASRLRRDHQPRITSRSTSPP